MPGMCVSWCSPGVPSMKGPDPDPCLVGVLGLQANKQETPEIFFFISLVSSFLFCKSRNRSEYLHFSCLALVLFPFCASRRMFLWSRKLAFGSGPRPEPLALDLHTLGYFPPVSQGRTYCIHFPTVFACIFLYFREYLMVVL